MTMSRRKKIIRTSVFAGILLLIAVGILLRFSIEPANYRGPLQKAVATAADLADSAVLGNENGQYSKLTVAGFQKQIEAADQLLQAEQSAVSQQKQQLTALKQATEEFKNATNQNSLSAEELKQLKEQETTLTREVAVTSEETAVWEINLEAVEQPEAINFDIRPDSANQEEIDSLLKDKGEEGTLLSFRHNGELPVYAVVHYTYATEEPGAYLYHYNEDDKALDYVSTVTVVNNQASLAVNEGGDWILVDHKLDQENSSTGEGDTGETEPSSSSEENGSSEVPGQASSGTSSTSSSQSSSSSSKSSGGLRNDSPSSGSGQTGAASSGEQNSAAPPPEQSGNTCTIEIRCDTILNNMDQLKPEKAPYVPANGVILSRVQVNFVEGDSVFDVLQAVTYDYGIHMDSINSPTYSGAYIRGIGNLYEFDCGSGSGWMYKVNGWFPNYGISNYKVKSGDVIGIVYTCDIGKDVGDQYYD